MESRLVRSLRERAAAATDPVQAAVFEAQIAICHAPQGEFDEAEAIVRRIRERFGGERPSAEALAWASLAEAVTRFYQHPGPQAADRLLRAQALGRMLPPTELQPLCAAWLAHVEFNANRMERMVGHAGEALRLAQPDHHSALARVSLVVADAYHFAGRFDLAKGWYAAVHSHAVAEGDDAMLSALMHNRATLRTNLVRLASAFGRDIAMDVKSAQMDTESTQNFDVAIGTRSLSTLLPLVQAQLFMVGGRYQDAIRLFGISLDENRSDNLPRREACFYAERGWCHLRLGQTEAALADANAAASRIALVTDSDDLAVAHARIAEIFSARGESERCAEHRAAALHYLEQYESERRDLLALLERGLVSSESQSN